MKDTTSVCQDIDSNRITGSVNDAVSNYFELEGHQHKKMVTDLLKSVDLHPIQFQSQVGGTFTAFASRRSIKRHTADDSKKEKTWKVVKMSDNAEPTTKCSHTIKFEASKISNKTDNQYQSLVAKRAVFRDKPRHY
ncbi:hypothetical protein PS15m_010670 [Mucor circinelloides]